MIIADIFYLFYKIVLLIFDEIMSGLVSLFMGISNFMGYLIPVKKDEQCKYFIYA